MVEDYIKMRNSGKYDLGWFYRHYVESGGKEMDINSFGMIFNQVNLNNILHHIDKKFELTRIEDNNGNFIKVI